LLPQAGEGGAGKEGSGGAGCGCWGPGKAAPDSPSSGPAPAARPRPARPAAPPGCPPPPDLPTRGGGSCDRRVWGSCAQVASFRPEAHPGQLRWTKRPGPSRASAARPRPSAPGVALTWIAARSEPFRGCRAPAATRHPVSPPGPPGKRPSRMSRAGPPPGRTCQGLRKPAGLWVGVAWEPQTGVPDVQALGLFSGVSDSMHPLARKRAASGSIDAMEVYATDVGTPSWGWVGSPVPASTPSHELAHLRGPAPRRGP
jgi:hypothetical protein